MQHCQLSSSYDTNSDSDGHRHPKGSLQFLPATVLAAPGTFPAQRREIVLIVFAEFTRLAPVVPEEATVFDSFPAELVMATTGMCGTTTDPQVEILRNVHQIVLGHVSCPLAGVGPALFEVVLTVRVQIRVHVHVADENTWNGEWNEDKRNLSIKYEKMALQKNNKLAVVLPPHTPPHTHPNTHPNTCTHAHIPPQPIPPIRALSGLTSLGGFTLQKLCCFFTKPVRLIRLAVPESVTITHAGELIAKDLLEERADTGTGHVILGKAANQSVYVVDRTVPAQHAHQATRTKQRAPSNTHQANVKTLARQRASKFKPQRNRVLVWLETLTAPSASRTPWRLS